MTGRSAAAVATVLVMACIAVNSRAAPAVEPSLEPGYDTVLHMNSYTDLHVRSNPSTEWVWMRLIVKRHAWVAVAITRSFMVGPPPSDGAVGLPETMTVGQCDLVRQEPGGLVRDAENNLLNRSITVVDGVTTLTFARKFHTGDPSDLDILRDAPTRMLVAHGEGIPLAYHGPHKGVALVDFRNTSNSEVLIAVGTGTEDGSGDGGDGGMSGDQNPNLGGLSKDDFEFQTTLTDVAWLRWKMSEDKLSVTFQLEVNRNSWVALGFSEAGEMVGPPASDAVVGKPGEGTVRQYNLNAKLVSSIDMDAQQDLVATYLKQEDGRTWMTFTRPLAIPTDPTDRTLSATKSQHVIFSYGRSNSFGYHKERGSLQLTIGTGCASVPITGSDDILRARLVHGYSMFFGWSTIVSLGIIIARYFRHKRWWLRAHVSLQSAGSIGTVSAATVAAANTKGHFAHMHSVIGIFIAVFTVMQAVAGSRVHAFRSAHPLDKDTRLNLILTWFHRVNGKVVLLSAAYNMTLGIRMLTEDPVLLHGLTAYLCCIGGVFLVLEVRHRVKLYRFYASRKRRRLENGRLIMMNEAERLVWLSRITEDYGYPARLSRACQDLTLIRRHAKLLRRLLRRPPAKRRMPLVRQVAHDLQELSFVLPFTVLLARFDPLLLELWRSARLVTMTLVRERADTEAQAKKWPPLSDAVALTRALATQPEQQVHGFGLARCRDHWDDVIGTDTRVSVSGMRQRRSARATAPAPALGESGGVMLTVQHRPSSRAEELSFANGRNAGSRSGRRASRGRRRGGGHGGKADGGSRSPPTRVSRSPDGRRRGGSSRSNGDGHGRDTSQRPSSRDASTFRPSPITLQVGTPANGDGAVLSSRALTDDEGPTTPPPLTPKKPSAAPDVLAVEAGADSGAEATASAPSASDGDSGHALGWRAEDKGVKRNVIATHLQPGREEFLLHPFLVLQGTVTADVLDWQLSPIMRVTYHAGDSCFSRGLLRQRIVSVTPNVELLVADNVAFQEFAGPRSRFSPSIIITAIAGLCVASSVVEAPGSGRL